MYTLDVPVIEQYDNNRKLYAFNIDFGIDKAHTDDY